MRDAHTFIVIFGSFSKLEDTAADTRRMIVRSTPKDPSVHTGTGTGAIARPVLQPASPVAVRPASHLPSSSLPAPTSGGRVPSSGHQAGGSGRGLATGGFVQHALAKTGADLAASLEQAWEHFGIVAASNKRSQSPPVEVVNAAGNCVELMDAHLRTKGVRTTRTATGIQIEPNRSTPIGRYAMQMATWTGASVVFDPIGRWKISGTAVYNRETRSIHCDTTSLLSGIPDENEMHEAIHALFHQRVNRAGVEHPLDGWCYRSDGALLPLLGYERGFSREEIATHAFQASLRQDRHLGAFLQRFDDPTFRGNVRDLGAAFDQMIVNDPAVYMGQAFASYARESALRTVDTIKRVGTEPAKFTYDPKKLMFAFGPNQEWGVEFSATHAEDGRRLVKLTVNDRSNGTVTEVTDADPALYDGIQRGKTPQDKARAIALLKAHVTERLHGVAQASSNQLAGFGKLTNLHTEVRTLLTNARGPSLSDTERSKAVSLLSQMKRASQQLRDVFLNSGGPLLPFGFRELEEESNRLAGWG